GRAEEARLAPGAQNRPAGRRRRAQRFILPAGDRRQRHGRDLWPVPGAAVLAWAGAPRHGQLRQDLAEPADQRPEGVPPAEAPGVHTRREGRGAGFTVCLNPRAPPARGPREPGPPSMSLPAAWAPPASPGGEAGGAHAAGAGRRPLYSRNQAAPASLEARRYA